MDSRSFIADYMSQRIDEDPSSQFNGDLQTLLDTSRREDLNSRVENATQESASEVKDEVELANELPFSTVKSEPADGSAISPTSPMTHEGKSADIESLPHSELLNTESNPEAKSGELEISPSLLSESSQDPAEPESSASSSTTAAESNEETASEQEHAVPVELLEDAGQATEVNQIFQVQSHDATILQPESAETSAPALMTSTEESAFYAPAGREAEFTEMLNRAEETMPPETSGEMNIISPEAKQLELPPMPDLSLIDTAPGVYAASSQLMDWDRR